MRLNWHIFPVAALLLLQGCSVSDEEYMAFDDVTVASLPDFTSYGKFIKNGNGPIEATSAPFFSGAIISGTESGERLIVKAGDKMLSLNAGTPFDPDNDAISFFKDIVSNIVLLFNPDQ